MPVTELTDSDERAAQPPLMRVQLRPHQLTALARCRMFERGPVPLDTFPTLPRMVSSGSLQISVLDAPGGGACEGHVRLRMGIIADTVGSGKSFVALGIIAADKTDACSSGGGVHTVAPEPFVSEYGGNQLVVSVTDLRPEARVCDVSVVVVPHQVCKQWLQYIERVGCLRCLAVYRTAHLQALLDRRTELGAHYDVLLVTNTFYAQCAALMRGCGTRMKRVFYDEADAVALRRGPRIEAAHAWYITATYHNLLHPSGTGFDVGGIRAPSGTAVRAVFDDMYASTPRELMNLLVVKSTDAYVNTSLELAPPTMHNITCLTPTSIYLLNGVVEQHIIDSLNAGDVGGAIAHVAAVGSQENIVALLVDRFTRQLRSLEQRESMTQSVEFDNESEKELELARLRKRREDAEHKMRCIRRRVTEADVCCICYDAIANKAVAPCCSNSFCGPCIMKWIHVAHSCPLCHAPLTHKDILLISEGPQGPPSREPPHPPALRSKYDELDALLGRLFPADGGRPTRAKVLVFSAYDHTFGPVKQVVEARGLTHDCIRGNMNTIGASVQAYKSGSTDVLMINAHNNGSGLNLENTTDIILFHRCPPMVEKQVIGRAQRGGRQAPLHVHSLLYENEALDG